MFRDHLDTGCPGHLGQALALHRLLAGIGRVPACASGVDIRRHTHSKIAARCPMRMHRDLWAN